MTDLNTLRSRLEEMESQIEKIEAAEEKGTLTHTKFSKLFHEARTEKQPNVYDRYEVIWDLDDGAVTDPYYMESGTNVRTDAGKVVVSMTIQFFASVETGVNQIEFDLKQKKMELERKVNRKEGQEA
jgi:hypothetical protein